MNPFDADAIRARALRFDVLALAYQMFKDEIVDNGDKTVIEVAERLMTFVDGQAMAVA